METSKILRTGKTNERCLFGGCHLWTALGDASACGTCGRLDSVTAKALGVDQNSVKVNIHEIGWLLMLRDAVGVVAPEGCTGTRYFVNPDAPGEGYDIAHYGPCPAHLTLVCARCGASIQYVPKRDEWRNVSTGGDRCSGGVFFGGNIPPHTPALGGSSDD